MASTGPLILLIQPEHDDREMYATYLHHHGIATRVVSTGREALSIVPNVDVVVTAIRLPGKMDGLELIETLRAGDRRHVPVIVLTACASPRDRERAFAAGCDAFLSKPCLPETLLTEIDRAWRALAPSRSRSDPPGP